MFKWKLSKDNMNPSLNFIHLQTWEFDKFSPKKNEHTQSFAHNFRFTDNIAPSKSYLPVFTYSRTVYLMPFIGWPQSPYVFQLENNLHTQFSSPYLSLLTHILFIIFHQVNGWKSFNQSLIAGFWSSDVVE